MVILSLTSDVFQSRELSLNYRQAAAATRLIALQCSLRIRDV